MAGDWTHNLWSSFSVRCLYDNPKICPLSYNSISFEETNGLLLHSNKISLGLSCLLTLFKPLLHVYLIKVGKVFFETPLEKINVFLASPCWFEWKRPSVLLLQRYFLSSLSCCILVKTENELFFLSFFVSHVILRLRLHAKKKILKMDIVLFLKGELIWNLLDESLLLIFFSLIRRPKKKFHHAATSGRRFFLSVWNCLWEKPSLSHY